MSMDTDPEDMPSDLELDEQADLPFAPGDALDLDVPDDPNLFDGTETGFILEQPLVRKPRYFARIPAARIKTSNAAAFVASIEMPEEGGYIEALLSGSFIFGDVLVPLCARMGGDCRITLSTLSYGPENLGAWHYGLESGLFRTLAVIASDYFYAHERSGLFGATIETLAPYIQAGRFAYAVAGSHTKITCIEGHRHKVVLRGSANLRSSENVEEVMMMRDAASHDWHRQWMHDIINRYAVTQTPQRVGNLWASITRE